MRISFLLVASLILTVSACDAKSDGPPPPREPMSLEEARRRWKEEEAAEVARARAAVREPCLQHGGKYRETGYGGECDGLPQPDVAWTDVPDDVKEACAKSGGSWREFSSTHTDPCEFAPSGVSGQAMTWGCECGPTRCSVASGSKVTCVDNPKWHRAVKPRY